MKQRPFLPLVEPDLDGPGEVLLERTSHPLPRVLVEDQNVALGVELKGAEVEI
jgi:hypothetical protein